MEFIDLGLPSGTLWKAENEEGFYTFNDAVEKYGDSMPTKEQWEELKYKCKWEWNGNGYDVEGPNGNSITLPVAGLRDCVGYVDFVDSDGLYWSSTPDGLDYAWDIFFNSDSVYIGSDGRHNGLSVRLVK